MRKLILLIFDLIKSLKIMNIQQGNQIESRIKNQGNLIHKMNCLDDFDLKSR